MHILKSGIQTILVDNGRFGQRHLGITQAGAMDSYRFQLANILLNNDLYDPTLEVLMGGIEVEFQQDCFVCVTGANAPIKLNGEPQHLNCPILIKKQDVLEIRSPRVGMRNYLAISNIIDVPKNRGSNTTSIRDALGGCSNGEAIKDGTYIPIVNSEVEDSAKLAYENYKIHFAEINTRISNINSPIKHHKNVKLEYVPAYQYLQFSRVERLRFQTLTYRVTQYSDRMGTRLEGESIFTSPQALSMPSEGIALGAIQIMPNGKPIVMSQERQTIGGYPKIGTLTNIALSKLSQLQPGEQVEFQEVDIYTSRQSALLINAQLNKLSMLTNQAR